MLNPSKNIFLMVHTAKFISMEDSEFRGWLSRYTDSEACLEAFQKQKTFFRVNTLKKSLEEFRSLTKLDCRQAGCCREAFGLEESIPLGRTWEYFLGYIHPQSLSSILVSLVLAPSPEDFVLDAAASPGSKFSHLAMLMENRGVLVGNDFKKQKISALYATINRLNVLNCIVTLRDAKALDWKERFDKVLLDAPCTALGSGSSASSRWEPSHSERISGAQKRMLFSAYDSLKPGGTLVYSTCTYAKEENEEVVANLLENVPGSSLREIPLEIPHEPGLGDYGQEFRKCLRIYPQHLHSEGFFIAKIRKGE
ncbi:NOL1/NOP2/sun family putative RNA methylase [Candidatus Micrarchaeota archaeon]|nr:NOL1/NOP2/sun family putative RNA methylase [Candidatus Micrarchaeota archaeon]